VYTKSISGLPKGSVCVTGSRYLFLRVIILLM